ncbi:MAG: hypothetical protein Q9187_006001 [Circinaria calcarea]
MDILESCLSQINTLTTITTKLEGGLRNSTSSGRKWGAFKAVLKGNKIKKFQDILRDIKITLVLVQQGGLSPPLIFETRAAQADLESHVGALQSQVSSVTSTIPNPVLSVGLAHGIGRALEQTPHDPSPRVFEVDTVIEDAASGYSSDPDSRQVCSHDVITHRSDNVVESLFGTFCMSFKVSQAGRSRHKDPGDLDGDDFIRTTSIRIHPARWLMQLGLNSGIQLALQDSGQGWKHTLNTFRAVPDDAAIFTACSKGDIDAVKQLLETNKASVWDVDVKKWTPLHIKTRGVDPVGNIETSQTNTSLDIEEQESKGIHCPCVQSYDFVCWERWAELKDLHYQRESEDEEGDSEESDYKESDSEESSSPTIKELSDWEESPFLPPLNIFQ